MAGDDKAMLAVVVLRAAAWLEARGFDLPSAAPVLAEMIEQVEHHFQRDRALLVGLAARQGDTRGAGWFVADASGHAKLDAWAAEMSAKGFDLLGLNVALTAAELRAADELEGARHVH
jgi:hypothetical protein